MGKQLDFGFGRVSRVQVGVLAAIIVVVVLSFAFLMQDAEAQDYRYPPDIDITLIHSDDENQYGGNAEGGEGGLGGLGGLGGAGGDSMSESTSMGGDSSTSISIIDERPSVQTIVGGASTYSVTNSTAACLKTGSRWWHRSHSYFGLWADGAKQIIDDDCVERLQRELNRSYDLQLIGLIDDPAVTRAWACAELGVNCPSQEAVGSVESAVAMFTGEECDERDRRQDEVCWSEVSK